MSQKNQTLTLLLALIITGGLLATGVWWLINKFSPSPSSTPPISNSTSPSSTSPISNSPASLLSQGEKLLVTDDVTQQKQTAINYLAAKDYQQAIVALEKSLQENPNDPEALIYLNNARIGEGKAYTIAVSMPIGEAINPAKEMLRGIAQAQNEINTTQGGINGIPLKVIIANDNNDPTVVKQIAQDLVNNPEVLGVVGSFGSDTSLAGAQIYQANGLVMISPTSTSVKLSEVGNYIYRTVPSDQFTGTTLANYMLNKWQKTKGVIFYNGASNYSVSLKNAWTTAMFSNGGEILTEFDLSNPNFNAGDSVEQAKKLGAEVLMLASNSETLNQALLVIQSNNQQLLLMGGDSLYNPKVLQIGGADAVNMVVAVPWHILAHYDSPFVKEANQLWGADINWRTAMAYDATMALIAAIKQNPTRQGVQASLSSSNFATEGASGVIRFLPSGDRNQALQLVKIVPGKRSGFGYDFVPIE